MTKQDIQFWLQSNSKYFPEGQTIYLRDKLANISEEQFLRISTLDYKDPTMMMIISIFVGGLGIDRFMLGDTGMGVLKLLTAGCCGILWLIDIFTIGNKSKEFNLNKLNQNLVLTSSTGIEASSGDISSELLKYKNLLDQGVITEEEFKIKKEEILKKEQ